MIKRIIVLILILNCIILSTNFVLAKPNNSISPEAIVKEFLSVKMNTLVSKNVDNIDKYYSSRSPYAQKYMLFTKQELLQDYLIAYSSNDYAIEKVSPQVKIISSIIKCDTATVEAILKTKIYWNASNALGNPIVGMKSEKHLLNLIMENNQWKIVVDQYMTIRGHSDASIKEDFIILNETIEKLKKEAKASLDRSKRSKPARLTMAFSEAKIKNHNTNNMLTIGSKAHIKRASKTISENVKSVRSSTATIHSYNRNGAYNWAHTYWEHYSTAYVNLGDQKWEGGDCTNFVSQCLNAGGANNDKAGSYQWYYDSKGTAPKTSDDSYSWTWSTSRGLNSIILGNYKGNEYGPKGTEKVITGDSQYSSAIGQYIMLGDLIQYQWKPTMKLTHSAIIVNLVYNSSKESYEPVIAEHTYDSWYTPWTNNAYKTHFVHIEGIN